VSVDVECGGERGPDESWEVKNTTLFGTLITRRLVVVTLQHLFYYITFSCLISVDIFCCKFCS